MPFQVTYNIPPSMAALEPNLGEGVSRPVAGAKTKLFNLLVTSPGYPAMKVTMRAETAAKAKLYASNCWPGSNIMVVK